MNKTFIAIGAVMAALSVALGAFGAHALKAMLEESGRTATYETAARYQMYHALAMVLVGILLQSFRNNRLLAIAGWAFLIGIFIFSGSLYTICFTGITIMGAVAPIGGLAFILGWVLIAVGVMKK
jgi:uncharacterized membrane protein YgdD (TMEM256/DUF423 family)